MSFHKTDINKIKKSFAIFIVLSGLCLHGYGQAVGDYRTVAGGNWNTVANWQRCVTAGTWAGATSTTYPGQNAGTGTVTIRNNHNVTLNVSPANNIGALTINTGANATALTFGAFTLNVAGDVNVNSTSNDVAKSIALNTGTLSCNNLYLTSSIAGNDNRDAFVVLTSGTLNVNGNITMNAVAARTYILFNGGGTVNVRGTITGGTITSTAGGGATAPTSGTIVYNNAGAQNVGTYAYFNLGISGSGSKAIQGNISVAGTLTLTAGTLTIGTNTLTLSDGANLSYGGGSLTGGATSNLTIGTGTAITLNAISGGLNNFNTSRDITLGADLTVAGTLTLTAGTFTVGANTLTLNGPTIAGTPANLATTSSSSLVFGGTSAGVLIPTSVVALNNLTISNTSIVTLQSSPTVSGTFTPGGGGLSIGANTLTLNGPASCGTLVGGATSNLIIGGAGAANIPAVTLNNLTLNKAAAMCGNVTVGGTLALNTGALSIAANTLTLSNGANLSYAGGSLTGGATSNLTIGTGTAITLNTISGGLNNFNTSRNITLGADLTVAGTLTLGRYIYSGANTLTLNGPTIAGTPANLATTSSSSLVFGGTSAGVLIPTSVVALNNLTISNTSIVTLQSSPTVSGTFTPGGGGLSIGVNTLTLNGPASCGTLVGGATSNLIIGGAGAANIPAVTLNNLTLNKAAAMCGNVTVEEHFLSIPEHYQ